MHDTTTLKTIYDFGKSSMRYGDAAIPFIFTIVGVILVIYALKTHNKTSDRSKTLIFGLIMVVGSLLMSNLMLNNNDFKKTQGLLETGKYQTVQDTVRNYNMRTGGRNACTISFDIGNIHFDLDNYSAMNYGCTSDDINSRHINNGDYLYINYIVTDTGNKILRIKRE